MDRACPHMGMDLAKGKICDGAVVCPYHGAPFSLATGEYTGESFVSPLRMRMYPTALHYGWVWFYNGKTPRYELPVFDPNEYNFSFQQATGQSSFDNMMLNALDSLHFCYLHSDILTSKDRFYQVEPMTDYSFRCRLDIDEAARGKLGVELMDRQVYGPSVSINAITVGGHTDDYRIFTVCPKGPKETQMVTINCTPKKRDKKTSLAYLPQLVPPWLSWLVPNVLFYIGLNYTLFYQDLVVTKNIIGERRSPDLRADQAAIQYLKVLSRLRTTS
jgi:phenylpropionate dioxygenase-like ring-hydroxylating dioxygenase large terminal subunit